MNKNIINKYSDITPEMCKKMKGEDIKWRGRGRNSSIAVVRNGEYDHTVQRPYNEIEDDKEYIVYECGHVAGSGICYTYMCIMVWTDETNSILLTDEEYAMNIQTQKKQSLQQ